MFWYVVKLRKEIGFEFANTAQKYDSKAISLPTCKYSLTNIFYQFYFQQHQNLNIYHLKYSKQKASIWFCLTKTFLFQCQKKLPAITLGIHCHFVQQKVPCFPKSQAILKSRTEAVT